MTTTFTDADLGIETLIDAGGIHVYYGYDHVLRAVYQVGEDGEPLPGCDPAGHGYMLVQEMGRTESTVVAEVLAAETWARWSRENRVR